MSYSSSYYNDYVIITNLPKICLVSIYNSSGALINKFDKNNSDTFLKWDLKNLSGEEIANGVYIIHINAPGIGEKILKWFGSIHTEE
jgi:hypothetical protein